VHYNSLTLIMSLCASYAEVAVSDPLQIMAQNPKTIVCWLLTLFLYFCSTRWHFGHFLLMKLKWKLMFAYQIFLESGQEGKIWLKMTELEKCGKLVSNKWEIWVCYNQCPRKVLEFYKIRICLEKILPVNKIQLKQKSGK